MEDNNRFDGLFMSAIQQCEGIENFYNYLFSFMRRKTDFYTMEDKSAAVVMKALQHHQALFKENKKKEELIR